jgi:exopolyphosphatase/guanosine-5'-triphosphate,3'-diphosphate pyrophosphatase
VNITILDLGSNSFQLLQARRTEADRVEPLYSAVEFVQLANFVNAQGVLEERGMVAGIEAIQSLLQRSPPSCSDGPVSAVATCAIRDAKNGAEFVERVSAQTGLTTRVLSGEDEASLTYWGASSELGKPNKNLAVVDLGGGSTQIAWGNATRVEHRATIKLGVLALAERLSAFKSSPSMALDQMAAYVRRTIEPHVLERADSPPDTLVFASGVARVILSLVYSYGLLTKGTVVPQQILADLVPKLLSASSEDLAQRGVPPKRLASVGPTAVVLGVITDLFELDRFVVTRAGLREGIVLHAEHVGMQPWPKLPS